MDEKMVKDATHIYLCSYMEALGAVKTPNLAVQCAIAVTTVLVNRAQGQQGMDPLGMVLASVMKEVVKRSAKGSTKPDKRNEEKGDGGNE